MATGGGGGKRPWRRMPLADLTNLSSSTSRLTRLKAPAQSKSCITSSSSIGSSACCPPPSETIFVAAFLLGSRWIRDGSFLLVTEEDPGLKGMDRSLLRLRARINPPGSCKVQIAS